VVKKLREFAQNISQMEPKGVSQGEIREQIESDGEVEQ
jgi:hypothetical protein